MEVLVLCLHVPDFVHRDIAIVVKIIHIEIDLCVLFTHILSLFIHDSLEFIKADAATLVSIPVDDIKLGLAQAGYFDREYRHAELGVSDLAITVSIKSTVSAREPFVSALNRDRGVHVHWLDTVISKCVVPRLNSFFLKGFAIVDVAP